MKGNTCLIRILWKRRNFKEWSSDYSTFDEAEEKFHSLKTYSGLEYLKLQFVDTSGKSRDYYTLRATEPKPVHTRADAAWDALAQKAADSFNSCNL